MKCRNCSLKLKKKIVEIGNQPISSIFYKNKKYNLKKYPLDLFKCSRCSLVQLLKNAPLKEMYGENYGYKTSISNMMVGHLKKKFFFLSNKIKKKNFSVLDIGSNDGTFLNFFKKQNLLIGIDPSSNKFKNNYKKNIYRINSFFSEKKIRKFLFKKKIKEQKFDIITSFAIFYDINNPNLFCQEVHNLLKPNGLWVVEFSYLPLMLKNLTYDQICHEHVTYYSLKVFNRIIKKHGLVITNARTNEINGGSIEVICTHRNNKILINKKNITNYINDEKKITNQAYLNFKKRIDYTKKNLNIFFKENKNKKIIGYGASTKGNIILNHCGINNKTMKYICDDNPFKKNMFTPGSNIQIITKKQMRKLKPDYLIVLIWSFRQEVINQEIDFIKRGGRLIFLLPQFHIIDKENYKFYKKSNFEKLSYTY